MAAAASASRSSHLFYGLMFLNLWFVVREKRGLAFLDLQFAFEIFKNDVPAFDMTGGSQAYFYRVSAGRVETELVVKGGHPVDL